MGPNGFNKNDSGKASPNAQVARSWLDRIDAPRTAFLTPRRHHQSHPHRPCQDEGHDDASLSEEAGSARDHSHSMASAAAATAAGPAPAPPTPASFFQAGATFQRAGRHALACQCFRRALDGLEPDPQGQDRLLVFKATWNLSVSCLALKHDEGVVRPAWDARGMISTVVW